MEKTEEVNQMLEVAEALEQLRLQRESSGVTPNVGREYVEMLQTWNRVIASKRGSVPLAYRGAPDFLVKHGRVFEPSTGPLPKGLKRGTPKYCYFNCYEAVRRNKRIAGSFAYAEGYAVPLHGIAIEHAWLVDRKTGQAVELTLREPATAYFGSTFKTAALARALAMNEVHSILFAWMGKHFNQLMEGGIKAEDVLEELT